MSTAVETSSNSGQPHKRRRIALACQDCRHRKLKCDRAFPICGRCAESRHPEQCTYDPNAVEEISSRQSTNGNAMRRPNDNMDAHPQSALANPLSEPATVHYRKYSASDAQDRIQQLEHRIIGLEKLVNSASHVASHSRAQQVLDPISPSSPRLFGSEWQESRGKNYKTQFVGASHPKSYLSQMPTLRAFLKEIVAQEPQASKIREEIKSSRAKHRADVKFAREEEQPLRALLPQRNIADFHINLYTNTFEYFNRVLHMPSFHEEYADLWLAPENARPIFVAIVLLMISATFSLLVDDPEQQNVSGTLSQTTAFRWISKCDAFIEGQSQKHTTLAYMQAQCILLIAKKMQTYKTKRTWQMAGTLKSFAITRGYHRDVEIFNDAVGTSRKKTLSTFDEEMRKRLWSTISEIELQCAFEQGMPEMLPDLLTDCGPPSNCHDDTVIANMEHKPPSLPLTHFTRSSYQCVMSRSFQLRQQVSSIINGYGARLSHQEIVEIDGKLLYYLNQVPHWNDASAVVPRAFINLQLYEVLLYLHRPYVREESGRQSAKYSTMMHMSAAKAIVEIHDSLTSNGFCAIEVFKPNILTAALAICYDHQMSSALSGNLAVLYQNNDHVPLLDRIEELLLHRIRMSNVGVHDYFIFVGCLGVVRKATAGLNSNEEALARGKIIAILKDFYSRYTEAGTYISPGPQTNGAPSVTGEVQDVGATPATYNSSISDTPGHFGNFDLDLVDWDLEAFLSF